MNIITDDTVKFIGKWEGFSSKPYLDPTGTPTIGYGTIRYPNGRKVTIRDRSISKDLALDYMKHHITTTYFSWVNTNLPNLTQNQFDAIVSLIYNIGLGNFKNSSVYLFIRKNFPCKEISRAFKMWVKSKGKTLKGLINRRAEEAKLYCNEDN